MTEKEMHHCGLRGVAAVPCVRFPAAPQLYFSSRLGHSYSLPSKAMPSKECSLPAYGLLKKMQEATLSQHINLSSRAVRGAGRCQMPTATLMHKSGAGLTG